MFRRRFLQAFSLIETMVVLFLTAGMLFCVAKLTNQTLSTLKFLQEKSATSESATLACQRLASELRETVVAPDLSDGVEFQKVRPNVGRVVGNLVGSPVWTLEYPPSSRARIHYRQVDDRVMRQVNSELPLAVATKVNIFTVTPMAGRAGAYRIALSIVETRRAVTFETVVVCPGVSP